LLPSAAPTKVPIHIGTRAPKQYAGPNRTNVLTFGGEVTCAHASVSRHSGGAVTIKKRDGVNKTRKIKLSHPTDRTCACEEAPIF